MVCRDKCQVKGGLFRQIKAPPEKQEVTGHKATLVHCHCHFMAKWAAANSALEKRFFQPAAGAGFGVSLLRPRGSGSFSAPFFSQRWENLPMHPSALEES